MLCRLRFVVKTIKNKYLFIRPDVNCKLCFSVYTKPASPISRCIHSSFVVFVQQCRSANFPLEHPNSLIKRTSRDQQGLLSLTQLRVRQTVGQSWVYPKIQLALLDNHGFGLFSSQFSGLTSQVWDQTQEGKLGKTCFSAFIDVALVVVLSMEAPYVAAAFCLCVHACTGLNRGGNSQEGKY